MPGEATKGGRSLSGLDEVMLECFGIEPLRACDAQRSNDEDPQGIDGPVEAADPRPANEQGVSDEPEPARSVEVGSEPDVELPIGSVVEQAEEQAASSVKPGVPSQDELRAACQTVLRWMRVSSPDRALGLLQRLGAKVGLDVVESAASPLAMPQSSAGGAPIASAR